MPTRERRRDYSHAVGALLGERLHSLGLSRKVREHTAPLIWAEVVGPQAAAATSADRILDGGVLLVSCRSSAWTQELTFHKARILRSLNERLTSPRDPAPVVTDIRFTSHGVAPKIAEEKAPPLHPTRVEIEDVDLSPSEIAGIEASVAAIADDGLRERMRNARIADARLRTWRLDNGWAPCPSCGDLAPPRFPYDGTVACSRCRVARG